MLRLDAVIVLVSFLIEGNGFLYDLTYPVNNITLDWGGDQFKLNITREEVKGNDDYDSYYYQIDEISSPTHLGTHLDAPCHFAKDHWCVSDIPVERLFSRPGYVIDITFKCNHDEDCMLTVEDVESWLQEIGRVEEGPIVLIRTGWSKYWPDRQKYFGHNSKGKMHFPGISSQAAELIAKKANPHGIGIESASVDYGLSDNFQTHIILAKNNIFNLENIGPLIKLLPENDFLITALPVRIDNSSGSPVRIIAHHKNTPNEYLFLRLTITFLVISVVIFMTLVTR